jgi:protein-S-isoprenylcysteine O-methyltransferase Ste14
MSATEAVRTAGWMIAGIYATVPAFWMAVHPFAERWRVNGYHIKWLGAWWMLLWLIAWAIELPFRHALLYDKHWPWLITAALWTISAYVYSTATRTFTLDRVIGRHEIEKDRPQTLVTSGIYARVRNPLYSAHLCTVLGWAIGTGLTTAWTCTGFYWLTLMVMLPREEQELRRRFGSEYDEYAKREPRLIPRIWS